MTTIDAELFRLFGKLSQIESDLLTLTNEMRSNLFKDSKIIGQLCFSVKKNNIISFMNALKYWNSSNSYDNSVAYVANVINYSENKVLMYVNLNAKYSDSYKISSLETSLIGYSEGL